MADRPQLTFFCELATPALAELFSDPRVVEGLVRLSARVSLAILDFSDARAKLARELHQAGVPVVAWLLLPRETGYWLNVGNVRPARDRYLNFREWSRTQELTWSAIGLDFEPDYREVEAFLAGRRGGVVGRALRRLFQRRAYEEATLAYDDLAARMRADGFRLESYHLPLLLDDRKANLRFFRKLLGVIDVPVDVEVQMLYSSLVPRWGAGILDAYGPEADAIGVGITGGGVELPGMAGLANLTWEELVRDLHWASRWSSNLQIFSLEGCVRSGYWNRLTGLDGSDVDSLFESEAIRTVRTNSEIQTRLHRSNRQPVRENDSLLRKRNTRRARRFRRFVSIFLQGVRFRWHLFALVLLAGAALFFRRVFL
ncbi:MAG: hypothetical protein U1D30_02170 [Planctomycetota bacterium]